MALSGYNDWSKVVGLVLRCPFQHRLSSCPLKDFRAQHGRDWFRDVETMSETEVARLVVKHEECCARRHEASELAEGTRKK